MAFGNINVLIQRLATPGGITLVEQGEARLIMGRPEAPTLTVTAISDVVWHPAGGGQLGAAGSNLFVDTSEKITVYLRTEVLPAVVEPDGGSPWWILAGGRWFRVDSVDPWSQGGFWVAQCSRLPDSRAVGEVGFATVTPAEAALPAIALAPLVLSRRKAFTPQRSIRFVVDAANAGAGDALVAFTWPASLLAPADAPVFRATNNIGAVIVVAAVAVAAFGPNFLALLPRVAAADGSLRYEVG